MSKPIQLIYTGGTLGMVASASGLTPSADFPALLRAQLAQHYPELDQPWHITALTPLLDSSNISPHEWGEIAQAVRQVADNASRVVVLHGTDTLAFTGSALSFLLADVEIPVVMTGAMFPLGEPGNDALENVVLSMTAEVRAGTVALCFGGQMMSANRAIKMAGDPAGAFVAWHGAGRKPDAYGRKMLTQRLSEAQPSSFGAAKASVAFHRVMPGDPPAVLRGLADSQLAAVVLAVYGAGTIPSRNTEWVAALEAVCSSGATVVAVSQSPRAVLALGKYAASAPLVDLGVIDGGDMTAEAAYAKLVVLTELGFSGEERATLMRENVCGERGD